MTEDMIPSDYDICDIYDITDINASGEWFNRQTLALSQTQMILYSALIHAYECPSRMGGVEIADGSIRSIRSIPLIYPFVGFLKWKKYTKSSKLRENFRPFWY